MEHFPDMMKDFPFATIDLESARKADLQKYSFLFLSLIFYSSSSIDGQKTIKKSFLKRTMLLYIYI